MRVLHAALMSTPQRGVLQQMRWEAEAAESLGLPWRSVVYGSSSVADEAPELVVRASREPGFGKRGGISVIGSWVSWRADFYRWLREQSRSADLLLLRHTLHDPLRPWAIRHLDIPVVGFHHTLEVPELVASGRFRAAMVERVMGRECLRQSKGIVAVTDEILRYEFARAPRPLPGWVYPNGADISGEALEGRVPYASAPELLFVADEFVPWHGLDRLLDSLRASDRRLRLHLVGELGPSDEEAARADSRVVAHGRLAPNAIQHLARTCSVGLTSFALDRKNMTQACTLKTREYLQQGLPVFAGHEEVFPASFRYLQTGPADVTAIAAFAHSMGGVMRQNVRDEAAPFIDKRNLVAALYKQLEDLS